MKLVRRMAGLLTALALLALAVVAIFGPFPRVPDPASPAPGTAPWTDDGRAVALVVHPEAMTDLAWIDLLESVFGGVDVLAADDPGTPTRAAEADRALVVIGHETARRSDPDQWAALDTFVDAGGVLLLETPDGPWADLAGVDVASIERRDRAPWPGPRTPAAAFAVDGGGGPPGSLPPASLAVPLSSWRYGPRRAGGNPARPWIAAGGRPAVWSRAIERGAIVAMSHRLSRLARDLAEGSSADLAPEHAWTDAWTQVLLGPDAAPWPWPRWSNAAPGDDGWLLVCTADSSAIDHSTTRFVRPPSATPELADGIETIWPDPSAWDDAPPALRRHVRWGPLPVFREILRTAEQVTMLRGEVDGVLHRFSDRRPDDVAAVRAALADAGVRADLSHGPGRGAPGGFAAGTGRPRAPFSAPGGRLGFVELPHVAWWDSVDTERLTIVARNNARGAAGPLTLHVDDPRAWEPSVDWFAGHRLARVEDFLDWWDGRRRARLHWGRDRDRLVVSVDVPPDLAPGLALLLPRTWRDRALVDWSAPWSPARSRRLQRHDGTPWLEIEVPAGTRATLRATYAPRRP